MGQVRVEVLDVFFESEFGGAEGSDGGSEGGKDVGVDVNRSQEILQISGQSDGEGGYFGGTGVDSELVEVYVAGLHVKLVTSQHGLHTNHVVDCEDGSILVPKGLPKTDVFIVVLSLVEQIILEHSFRQDFLHAFVDGLVDLGLGESEKLNKGECTARSLSGYSDPKVVCLFM